jgi:hypothetical protein
VKVIGHDDEGEPIWQLTGEEYQQWKQRFSAAREKAGVDPQQAGDGSATESAPGTAAAGPSPQTMAVGSQIWEWRKKGVSVYEIHRKLGIPMEAVKEILENFERCFYPDVGQMIHHYAVLDDARLEALIARWLPAATGPAPEVEKIARNGQTYTELDTDTPVKAANVVLGAIKGRIQLLMACRPESVNGGKDGSGSTNILMWLNQVMPGVQKIVSQVERTSVSRGKQTLVLECEAEKLAQGNNSNGEPKR